MMKRLLALLLAAALLMSVGIVAASAETESTGGGVVNELALDPEDKLSENLRQKLGTMSDDDYVGVWAWRYDISEEQITALIIEAYGEEILDDPELLRQARSEVLSDYNTKKNREILDRLQIVGENRLFVSALTPSFIVRLTKPQVYALCAVDEVYGIDYYPLGLYDAWPERREGQHYVLLDSLFRWSESRFGGFDPLPMLVYNELYIQYDEDGAVDWALLQVVAGSPLPWERWIGGRIGDRLLYCIGGYELFASTYALYDGATGGFYDIFSPDRPKRPELYDTIVALGLGLIAGDADLDGELTIFDVTDIQRYLAQMADIHLLDRVCKCVYETSGRELPIADIDNDRQITIFDATLIQRVLAGLPRQEE